MKEHSTHTKPFTPHRDRLLLAVCAKSCQGKTDSTVRLIEELKDDGWVIVDGNKQQKGKDCYCILRKKRKRICVAVVTEGDNMPTTDSERYKFYQKIFSDPKIQVVVACTRTRGELYDYLLDSAREHSLTFVRTSPLFQIHPEITGNSKFAPEAAAYWNKQYAKMLKTIMLNNI